MNLKKPISLINQHGILLVFPIKNQKEPRSLWSVLHPRTPMRWEWDESGDNHVFEMWNMMKRLSENRSVVYSKWYQGRATFLSRELFTALLAELQPWQVNQFSDDSEGTLVLPHSARQILEVLESDSPLSTKELKRFTDLQGRDNEPEYNRSMKVLFNHLLIIAAGEVDDGSFPSLAVGATKLIYEELWNDAQELSPEKAKAIIDRFVPEGTLIRKYLERIKGKYRAS